MVVLVLYWQRLWSDCIRLFNSFVGRVKGSDCYLNGFQRLSGDIRYYIVVVSIVAFVPDNVLHGLLRDDRMVGRVNDFKQILDQ